MERKTDTRIFILGIILLEVVLFGYAYYVYSNVPTGVQVVRIQFAPGTHIQPVTNNGNGKFVPINEIPGDFENFKLIGINVSISEPPTYIFHIYGLRRIESTGVTYIVKSEYFDLYSLYKYFVNGGTNITISENGVIVSGKNLNISSKARSTPFVLLRMFMRAQDVHYKIKDNTIYISIMYAQSYLTLVYFMMVAIIGLIYLLTLLYDNYSKSAIESITIFISTISLTYVAGIFWDETAKSIIYFIIFAIYYILVILLDCKILASETASK